MKKFKPQEFKVEIDFLEYKINFFIVEDVDKFRRGKLAKRYPHLNQRPDDDEYYAVHIYNRRTYPRQSFVVFPTDIDPGTAIHEITHVVDRMTEFHGLEGTEIRAHLMEYIFNEVYRRLKVKL